MSAYRSNFTVESIGYYPNGKAIYLTVSPLISQEGTKLSILLEKSEENLQVLGRIIREQINEVRLSLDTLSRETITGRNGSKLNRFSATKIEVKCEPLRERY